MILFYRRIFSILLLSLLLIQCGGNDSPAPGNTPPTFADHCEYTAGDGNLLLKGMILLPQGLQQGEVFVNGDRIACAAIDCSGETGAGSATILNCGAAIVSPGFINSRDSLHYYGDPIAITEKYDHQQEWRFGLNGKPNFNFSGGAENEIAWNELRQLMSGTTSIVGGQGHLGLLRNLNGPAVEGLEGINHAFVQTDLFPLNDISSAYFLETSCDYTVTVPDTSGSALLANLAIGLNRAAHNEIICLNGLPGSAENYVQNKIALVSSININPAEAQLMADKGTALVWTPRSHTAIYGNTSPIPLLNKAGVDIALGTYLLPIGSSTVNRELVCANEWNNRWGNAMSKRELISMVTDSAARVLGFDDEIGSLEVGKVADLVVWSAENLQSYDAVLGGESKDIILVLRGGVVQFGDQELVNQLSNTGDCETIDVCGVAKGVCVNRELGMDLAALQSSTSATYPLFSCGTPAQEPTCIPSRPNQYSGLAAGGDNDGDGVSDGVDNCPNVFNPPLLIGDQQADRDGDGAGDLCDQCPLDANSSNCANGPNANALVSVSASAGTIAANSSGSITPAVHITLLRPVTTDTFIPVSSSNDNIVSVVGGGVTVAAGNFSAELQVNGVSGGEAVLQVQHEGAVEEVRVSTNSPLNISPLNGNILVTGEITLTITIDTPAPAGGKVVNLSSSSPSVSVPASVTIPQGASQIQFTATGVSAVSAAVVTANMDGVEVQSTINVLAQISSLSITPAEVSVTPSSSRDMQVTIQPAAGVAGITVVLSATPGTNITYPPTVNIPAGQNVVNFSVTAGATEGTEVLTANVGQVSDQSTITIFDPSVIYLAEVYYDHVGTDTNMEWVKLYNSSNSSVDLSNYSLGYGGTDYTFGTFQLSGTIPAKSCVIVGGPTSDPSNGSPVYLQSQDFNPDLQNSGNDADGVALFYLPATSITSVSVPIDAVIYGGININSLLDETGAPGTVDIDDAPQGSSIAFSNNLTWGVNATPNLLPCPTF